MTLMLSDLHLLGSIKLLPELQMQHRNYVVAVEDRNSRTK